MARPRTASDEDILRAAFVAIGRLGPSRLTLADVAREAGLTPAALVGRFGSKRGLLLAAAADAAGGDAYIFPGLRQRHPSPLEALYGLADCLAGLFGETPQAVAHNLAFMQAELSDPEFLQHAVRGSQGMRTGIRQLVRDSIAKGELRPCDAARLAVRWHRAVARADRLPPAQLLELIVATDALRRPERLATLIASTSAHLAAQPAQPANPPAALAFAPFARSCIRSAPAHHTPHGPRRQCCRSKLPRRKVSREIDSVSLALLPCQCLADFFVHL